MRERCRIEEGVSPTEDRSESISVVLRRVVRKLGAEDDMWLSDLAAAWPGIAGPEVARHTRPGRVNGTELTVFVDNSVWLSELHRFGRGTLLGKLRAKFGGRIASLRLAIEPDVRPRLRE
jgi:predicted nucleic acid-binding Zn ribbon protein